MERECSQGFRVEIFEENTTRSLTERSSKLDRGVVDRLPLAPFGRGEKRGQGASPLGIVEGNLDWVSHWEQSDLWRGQSPY